MVAEFLLLCLLKKQKKKDAELEAKLSRLRGGAKLVSKAEKEKAEKQYEYIRVAASFPFCLLSIRFSFSFHASSCPDRVAQAKEDGNNQFFTALH